MNDDQNKKIISQAYIDAINDIASDDQDDISSQRRTIRFPMDTHTPVNTSQAPTTAPSSQGEQSVSGSTPDPESDDDTLQNVQAMGMQLGEDEEHPQELDIARDINAAELSLKSK